MGLGSPTDGPPRPPRHPPLPEYINVEGTTIWEPMQKAHHNKNKWEKLWTKNKDSYDQVIGAIKTLVKAAAKQNKHKPMMKITAEIVREAIKEMKTKTALGSDCWEVKYLKTMSDEAIEELISLYEYIEEKGAWPTHTYTIT